MPALPSAIACQVAKVGAALRRAAEAARPAVGSVARPRPAAIAAGAAAARRATVLRVCRDLGAPALALPLVSAAPRPAGEAGQRFGPDGAAPSGTPEGGGGAMPDFVLPPGFALGGQGAGGLPLPPPPVAQLPADWLTPFLPPLDPGLPPGEGRPGVGGGDTPLIPIIRVDERDQPAVVSEPAATGLVLLALLALALLRRRAHRAR